jgi:soluble lytic murein transglycosylase-like protein
VVAAESAYRAEAVSPKGALGLMQLMPATARELGADPTDPRQNLDAGARYLRGLLIQYGHSPELALAAYNAGPGAVNRHGGVPPYRETRSYIQRVLRLYHQLQKR